MDKRWLTRQLIATCLLLSYPSQMAWSAAPVELNLVERWRVTESELGEEFYNIHTVGNGNTVWFGKKSGFHLWDRNGDELMHRPDWQLSDIAHTIMFPGTGFVMLDKSGMLSVLDSQGQMVNRQQIPGFVAKERAELDIVSGKLLVTDSSDDAWLMDTSFRLVHYPIHHDAHWPWTMILLDNGNLAYMLIGDDDENDMTPAGLALSNPDAYEVIDDRIRSFPTAIWLSHTFTIEPVGPSLFLARLVINDREHYSQHTPWYLLDNVGNVLFEWESYNEYDKSKQEFLDQAAAALGNSQPSLLQHLEGRRRSREFSEQYRDYMASLGYDRQRFFMWWKTPGDDYVYTSFPGLRISAGDPCGKFLLWLFRKHDGDDFDNEVKAIPLLRSYFERQGLIYLVTSESHEYIFKPPTLISDYDYVNVRLDERFAVICCSWLESDRFMSGYDIEGLPSTVSGQ
ncbi:MAG: hypothetical protein H7A35_07460 [Planctomycetales bacterium]|nr:hypothetical protein [bacterium]UNM09888.1 MAG: hypothetical protein H7A35_07460 [Planctomycetales bacterium]